jgi:hypothetical protein
MNHDELMQRIARTLRHEIGPALEAEYPKTQAFMAAVVVQKLGRQVGLARQHEAAESAALDALLVELQALSKAAATALPLDNAIAKLELERDNASLCALIEVLYTSRSELGETHFATLLASVRTNLRASIDRQMEYAA